MTRTVGLVFSGLALALLGAASRRGDQAKEPSVVRAPAFVVADKQGRERARLRLAEHGPLLELLDAEGRVLARLGVTEKDRTELTLFHPQTATPALTWAVTPRGPEMVLRSGRTGSRIVLAIDRDSGRAALSLLDERGRRELVLGGGPGPADPKGFFGVTVRQDGANRVALGVRGKDGALLRLWDSRGEVAFAARAR